MTNIVEKYSGLATAEHITKEQGRSIFGELRDFAIESRTWNEKIEVMELEICESENVPKNNKGEYIKAKASFHKTSTYKSAKSIISKALERGLDITGKAKSEIEAMLKESKTPEEKFKVMLKTLKAFNDKHALGHIIDVK